jgi:hypothetical protein
LHCPSGAKNPAWLKLTKTKGDINALTPPTSAYEHSFLLKAEHTSYNATIDDEHAVSTAIDEPLASNKYDILLVT